MPRPPKDDDATQNLRPEDETQQAKEGTNWQAPRRQVMADFKKVARTKR